MRSDLPIFGSPEGVGQLLRLAVSMKMVLCITPLTELKLITHTGTRVDAPGHFYYHYFDVNSLDLDLLNGPVLLVDFTRNMNITGKLFMYKNQFDTSFVGFTQDGAQWLKDHTDIKMVGVDYLSVASWDDNVSAHLVFLESRRTTHVLALVQINASGHHYWGNHEADCIVATCDIFFVHCLPPRLVGARGISNKMHSDNIVAENSTNTHVVMIITQSLSRVNQPKK
ncbi:hypothetical protein MKW92_053709 [Papaver armeniacum]|nr:hypothetical protein MKW92_053709 [Papaver armeniacum]